MAYIEKRVFRTVTCVLFIKVGVELHQYNYFRVQELAGDGRREAGRIPRTIECELTSDLVDSCVPGDMVTITAVVKATGSDDGEYRLITHPPLE